MSSNLRINRVCEYCKNSFVAKTTSTRFCSKICNGRNNKMQIRNLKIEKSNLETKVEIQKKSDGKIQTIDQVKDKDFLTVKDTSLLLNISTKTLYRLIERKEINAYRFSERKTLIRRKDIESHFDNNLIDVDNTNNYLQSEINLSNSYTINEAIEKFNISNGALYNIINRFNIPKRKVGKYTLVKKEDLNIIFQ